ncbi:hypothetical protein GSI_09738 [Ganoderma sinense ZZ0214-1]|uniref:Uncharacterized protein n=1 Tax=Ganoderma sinense ZZ0214-1 TaxID=1077348 RepID=A0A2G8S369_9APHY|nr:hypothetical protein GSI_09738 [Ganoderma sinense ZZ0214-1]
MSVSVRCSPSRPRPALPSRPFLSQPCPRQQHPAATRGARTHSMTSKRLRFGSRPSCGSSSERLLDSPSACTASIPWNDSPLTRFERMSVYCSSVRPMPASGLILPSSSPPAPPSEKPMGSAPACCCCCWSALAWTASALSNDGSESGGTPTERGTRERVWMTLRWVRCFSRTSQRPSLVNGLGRWSFMPDE